MVEVDTKYSCANVYHMEQIVWAKPSNAVHSADARLAATTTVAAPVTARAKRSGTNTGGRLRINDFV